MTPIGHFFSDAKERYEVASQPGLQKSSHGYIELTLNLNPDQALKDLEGFDRIWVIFLFHKNHSWNPLVMPPRGNVKRGVFATRSPHRPNPIGLSCVELTEIRKNRLYIASHDLLDQTPILDIKPYIPQFDSFPDSNIGWLNEVSPFKKFPCIWEAKAKEQALFIMNENGLNLISMTDTRLSINPIPDKRRRISKLTEKTYVLACKTWRIIYKIEGEKVLVLEIQSGYSPESLNEDEDRWGDKKLHSLFNKKYCK